MAKRSGKSSTSGGKSPRKKAARKPAARKKAAPKPAARRRGRTKVYRPPAPRKAPEALSRAELLALAEAAGIKYRTRMSKAQLLDGLGLTVTITPARRVEAPPAPPAPVAPAAHAVAASPAEAPTLPAGPAPETTYVDRGMPLPGRYTRDAIEAMVRDPHGVFVYWELSGGAAEKAPAGWPWVLRVNKVGPGVYFDQPVDRAAGNWYLTVEPECTYQVDLGCVGPRGEFFAVARSREVHTPAEGESPHTDAEWRTSEELRGALLGAMGMSEGEPAALGTPGSPWLAPEGAWSGGLPASPAFPFGGVGSARAPSSFMTISPATGPVILGTPVPAGEPRKSWDEA